MVYEWKVLQNIFAPVACSLLEGYTKGCGYNIMLVVTQGSVRPFILSVTIGNVLGAVPVLTSVAFQRESSCRAKLIWLDVKCAKRKICSFYKLLAACGGFTASVTLSNATVIRLLIAFVEDLRVVCIVGNANSCKIFASMGYARVAFF